MPGIRVKENEPFEVAIRRFKRTIEKVGLLPELRSREFYEKPTAERKRKLAAAVKRHHKRLRSQTSDRTRARTLGFFALVATSSSSGGGLTRSIFLSVLEPSLRSGSSRD